MYIPAIFAEARPEALRRIIREHPLGMLVANTACGLDANHLPFLLDETEGPSGILLAHVARANPLWTTVADGDPVLVVFRGADGYISPSWYPGKQDTHRYVPTWNYEAVHVHGRIRIRDDATFVRGVVARLTRRHEAGQPAPWKIGDAPPDYVAAKLREIVGLEVAIERIEGKRKLGQNRDARDFDGTIAALRRQQGDALADAMEDTRKAGADDGASA